MIICIGREFGSGGHQIGRKVAEKLGLELYDRDLIDRAREDRSDAKRCAGKSR